MSVRDWAAALAVVALTSGSMSAASARATAYDPQASGRPAGSKPHLNLTPAQASAKAARTRKAVPVVGAMTPTSTLTANPDGTFTVTESAAPVRAKVHGVWRDLNPTLIPNRDGTYSPATSSQPLVISGGGAGSLATMTYGQYSFAVSAPLRLPAPAVTGSTATYHHVLPGVDLIVTAEASGGFDEVLEIENAAAAVNPALQALTFTVRSPGLTLKTGRGGEIGALTQRGAAIFSAPAPRMWDSAAKPGTRTLKVGGTGFRVDRATGQPAISTTAGPGEAAHVAPLAVRVTGNRVTLTPDRRLLRGNLGVYPEFIDPNWVPAGSTASSWAYVSSDFPGQQYYNVDDYLQVGKNPGTGGTSYAFDTMSIPNNQIDGATINSVTAYFPEVWSDSCTASPVDLYETGGISGSTTFNNQPKWISKLGSDNVAFGWSSSGQVGGPSNCSYAAKDVAFTTSALNNLVQQIATTSHSSTLTVGLKAEDTSDAAGWKLFADPKADGIKANATMTIKYAHAPATPGLSTSPPANCATGTSVLGNGTVGLNAAVLDKDGTATGNLSVAYAVYAAGKTADTVASGTLDRASGTTATLNLTDTELDNAAATYGSSGQVKITWSATVSDGLPGVPTSSASCSFIFSNAIPGQPNITDSAGNPGCDTLSYTVGAAASFTLSPNAHSTVNPTSYTYQLNGGNPVTVAASTTSPFGASIAITPTRRTNVLIVNAVANSGNIGQSNYCVINAAAPATAADQDMSGDGIPDLLAVGTGTTGTAAGLWLASGQGSGGRFDGTVATTATDIAPLGPQDIANPAAWTGLRAITGQFTDGGFNDVEAYQPGTGNVYVLPGEGDGTATTTDEESLTNIFDDVPSASGNTDAALQLVNAYNVSADGQPYPDQIGVFSDTSAGAYLAYFANNDSFNSFDAGNFSGLPYELTNTTPDGTMDWDHWTITTDQDTRGGVSYTDMYLWNQSTGALYLWELTGLTNEATGGFGVNPAATLTYNQTRLSSSWDQNVSLVAFQATDIDGNPGLVTVTNSGQVQSYVDANGTLTQANASGPTQALVTADHTYLLDDATSGQITSAADQAGAADTAANLTGNSGTQWNAGDLFSPDASFNGTSGYLTTSGSAGLFAPNASFTVSAWVNLSKLGGVVFSQSGSKYSSVYVSCNANGTWSVSMNNGNTSGSTYVSGSGGTAQVGVWTNLTVTFATGNGSDIAKLYANGVEIAVAVDTTPPSTTGPFLLGAYQVNGTAAGFLNGQLADVQAWHSLASPVQSASPASVFVPINPVRIMDTRSGTRIGSVTGPVGSDSTTLLPVEGNSIASLPSSGITAVAVAVTVTGQTGGGILNVYPAGTPRPYASTVDYSPDTTTNDTIVPVGANGDIAIYNNSAGTAQLIVDVTGYFTSVTTTAGASTYVPLADPTTIVDTRSGVGAPKATIAANGTFKLMIDGNNTNGASLPGTGIAAVALNLTVVPTASGNSGNLITYPDGISRPEVSTVSYNASSDQSQAGTVLIPVGSDGEIDIFNASSTTINLVANLSGYFTTSGSGQFYHALDGTRIIDTRQSTELAGGAVLNIADPTNILADDPTLVLNIIATQSAAGGWLAAYPGTAVRPNVSIVNFAAGVTADNLALVGTSSNNSFNIANGSSGAVQVVVDTNGYFQ